MTELIQFLVQSHLQKVVAGVVAFSVHHRSQAAAQVVVVVVPQTILVQPLLELAQQIRVGMAARLALAVRVLAVVAAQVLLEVTIQVA
jgi:hypothetical protein